MISAREEWEDNEAIRAAERERIAREVRDLAESQRHDGYCAEHACTCTRDDRTRLIDAIADRIARGQS